MTDIFLSYAHEDSGFAKEVAAALEREGFDVWWDHAIPPGKTWDQVIARAIAEAKCCIVLWSRHASGSDWVKEEATLAKDASKLIPAVIDGSEPPVGFRRIQAANLKGWPGPAAQPQWALMVREARALVAGGSARPSPTSRPQPDAAPPAAPAKPPPWPLILGGGAVALVALFAALSNRGAPDGGSVAPYEELYPSTDTPSTEETATPAPTGPSGQFLTTEDASPAVEAQIEIGAEAARMAATAGDWEGDIRWDNGAGATAIWTLSPDGALSTSHNETGTWAYEGDSLVLRYTPSNNMPVIFTGAISGMTYAGRAYSPDDQVGGSFSMTRR